MCKVCYITDMLVASWNHGQEIITPLILRLSSAATQWLSRHSYDVFGSVGALLPHTTAVTVVDEMAKLYEGAFVVDTIRLAQATSKATSIWGWPRGMGGIPSSWNLPRRLQSDVMECSPSKTWISTPGWLSA